MTGYSFFKSAFKNVGVLCYTRCQSVRPYVPFNLNGILLLNPLGEFDENWHKDRSHCGDVHIVRKALSNVLTRNLRFLDLVFFEKYLFSQLLLNPLENFDEPSCKERSHCGDVHIVRESMFN
jgi:hypothetical protein